MVAYGHRLMGNNVDSVVELAVLSNLERDPISIEIEATSIPKRQPRTIREALLSTSKIERHPYEPGFWEAKLRVGHV